MFVSAERIDQAVDIVKHTVSIEEKGIKLRLTIIDTPGFGDAINNTEWWGHQCAPANSNQLDPDMTQCCITGHDWNLEQRQTPSPWTRLQFITSTLYTLLFWNSCYVFATAGSKLKTTSTSSLNSTSEMRVGWTEGTSRTTESTAASTSSPHLATGTMSTCFTSACEAKLVQQSLQQPHLKHLLAIFLHVCTDRHIHVFFSDFDLWMWSVWRPCMKKST